MLKKEFMTIPEAANYLSIPTEALEELINAGNGPPVCHISKDLQRIKRTALNNWMQRFTRIGAKLHKPYDDQ